MNTRVSPAAPGRQAAPASAPLPGPAPARWPARSPASSPAPAPVPARRRRRADLALVARLFVAVSGRRLLLGAALAALVVLAGMALLGLSGWFITATALAGASLMFNVFLPSAAIRLLALLRTFGRYGERLLTHDATLGAVAALRERLFRAWAQPAAAHTLLRRPARVLFRLTHDIDALESIYLRLLVPAGGAFAAAVLAGVVLASVDTGLGLGLAAWLLACGVAVFRVVARRARLLALRRARTLERLREAAIDLSAGQTELAMAGRLPAQCAALQARDGQLARYDDASHRLETAAGLAYGVAGHIGVAAVLLASAVLVTQQRIGAAAAALAILMTLTAFEPFAALRRGAMEAGRSALAVRRLAPRLRMAGGDGDPADLDHTSAGRADLANPAVAAADRSAPIVLSAASVIHPGRHYPALRALDLRIEAGERVALLGPSGAGKSTLLGLIAGEFPAASGRVQTRACSWLSQRIDLFQDSLRENLLLAAPQASDAQLWAALAQAGLDADVRQLAGGLDTPLGEGGLGLSGGQARRLALARLLLRGGDLWLLDEPTEALDAACAADLLARLAGQLDGRTVLLACHARREAALAERLLLIDAGAIVGDLRRGTPAFDAALAALRE